MVGAHRADVDRLQTAHTAVILELHTGKIANGIGYRETVESLQIGIFENLRRNHLAVLRNDGAADDDHLTDVLNAVQFSGSVRLRNGIRPDVPLCREVDSTGQDSKVQKRDIKVFHAG